MELKDFDNERNIKSDGEITEFISKKEVKKSGDGGHIFLPKGLIGKIVGVFYKK